MVSMVSSNCWADVVVKEGEAAVVALVVVVDRRAGLLTSLRPLRHMGSMGGKLVRKLVRDQYKS